MTLRLTTTITTVTVANVAVVAAAVVIVLGAVGGVELGRGAEVSVGAGAGEEDGHVALVAVGQDGHRHGRRVLLGADGLLVLGGVPRAEGRADAGRPLADRAENVGQGAVLVHALAALLVCDAAAVCWKGSDEVKK